jgi:Rieske 2Fe-2S family protein
MYTKDRPASTPDATYHADSPPSLLHALAQHRAGCSLPRAFVIDPAIHQWELERIWRSSWLFAGLSVQARDRGDYFLLDVAGDSVVIVRDHDGELHALNNTCRHRGTRLCSQPEGHLRRLVCPYHQWSYGLDGRLLGAGGMEREPDAGFDLDSHGLHRAAVTEIGGLVFVWLGPDPGPIDQAARDFGRALAAQGLERGRVACLIDYVVAANWKLVWENNRECWHCHAGHPQYVKANFDAERDTERNRARAAARSARHAAVLDGVGAVADDRQLTGLYRFPSRGRWWSVNRTPTTEGFVTESLDGQPVAPLMGAYPDYDVGTLRLRAVPNFWCHASADHAVLTRLLPDGPERTLVRSHWIVDQDAIEGRDYDLDRLVPFWTMTNEQDWRLCEANHAGIRSPAYTPGPYSPAREYNVIEFDDWYLERVAP